MDKFDLVISSNAPRAIETAVAMGFAVEEIHEEVSMTPKDIEEEVEWGMNFVEYAAVVKEGQKTAKYANEMSLFLKDIVKNLEENSKVLIVSHGGLIEIATIGCIPTIGFEQWGEALSVCEGVRLFIENNSFIEAEKIELDNRE